MSAARDMRQLLRRVADLGHKVSPTRNGHVKILTPEGPYYTTPQPSDHRAFKNLKSELRKRKVPV